MKQNKGFKRKMFLLMSLTLTAAIMSTGCSNNSNKPEGQYPSQNINGIIAWGAGGATDNTARRLQPTAEKVLGKSIIMSNKVGGSGILASQYVHNQNADGYTLIFNAETPTLYPVLGLPDLTYDKFEPIVLFAKGSSVIVVPKDSPYNSLEDLVKAAKANPGRINLGISGVGGQPYMTAAILKKVDGAEFNQVPYDGDSSLMSALLGKQIQVTALSAAASVQFINNGNMKAIAIMSDKRNDIIPDVPTAGESNAEYNKILKSAGFFNGVFVKKGTSEETIEMLRKAFLEAFKEPSFQNYVKENGMAALGLTGEEAKKYIKDFQSQMSWLVYEAGGASESPEKFGIAKP
jgi:tripartite-type tricarboxylate transporter receptor subunit TctC